MVSTILTIIIALIVLPGTIELAMLTIGAVLYHRRDNRFPEGTEFHRTAIIIPAHDEELHIQKTIKSLLSCEVKNGEFEIIVIADNCIDSTAEKAQKAGARVLERSHLEKIGKGYALDFAFKALLKEKFDSFIVVDADTIVNNNLIIEFQNLFKTGADAGQCHYHVSNPEASLRARLMKIAFLAFNILRPQGRQYFGFSVGLAGNGFGLSRKTIEDVPYTASSIVEDLEYHLNLVKAGKCVHFIDKTAVWSDMPTTATISESQRARWEGGRFRMIITHTPLLFKEIIFRRRTKLIEPLLELLLLPLAFHTLLILLALLLSGIIGIYLFAFSFSVLLIHILTTILTNNEKLNNLKALCLAPMYILWKLKIINKLFFSLKNNASWKRTIRDKKIS